MIRFRKADDRGHADHGWLDSHHSFSFADYHDAAWMGYSSLRVINEDRVAPGGGFPPHGHRDMEILSYVLDGGLGHRDSTGGSEVLRPGEMQLMSAGTGIVHSEMNASQKAPVHFLQIWIVPDRRGIQPGYQQHALDPEALRAGFNKLVAPASEGTLFTIQQDARLWVAWPAAGQVLEQPLEPGRRYYLQVARGALTLGEQRLAAGDAALLEGETSLAVQASEDSELLLFDLA